MCEALDQTRGWFYSLIAVSTLLFDQSPYRNVVCLGLILDDDGQKMSKSLGNTVEPWEVIDRYGADALRWYFFTSKQPWDGYRFSLETIGEAVRQFLLQLWNTYGFYVAVRERERDGARRRCDAAPSRAELDRWALSRLQRDGRDRARAHGRLRRDRRRPRDRRRSSTSSPTGTCAARAGASGTATRPRSRRCATCLVTVAKLLAPFCPFVADEIYDNLDGAEPSVHLCDFPVAGERDARARASDGRRARDGPARAGGARPGQAQGAPAAARGGRRRRPGASARRSSGSAEVVRDELNVTRAALRRPRPTSSARSRSSPTTARSGRASASRCRWWRRRSPALDPAHVAARAARGPARWRSRSTARTTS